MTIQEKENALFKRWKQSRSEYKSFDEDGVVKPAEWEMIATKLVFVLKETNGLNGDLRKFLREGGSPTYFRTWNNIVRWTNVVLFNNDTDKVNQKQRESILSYICAVNLKKESGSSRSKKSEIKSAALNDKKFIQEQMALYQPDIIIACGFGLTADTLRDIVYEDSAEWKTDNQLWYYNTENINNKKPIFVISMPHPNRASKEWSKRLRDLYNVLNKR